MLTWAAIVEHSAWKGFTDVKLTFPSADLLAGEKVCFDVGGNKWRIIANVAYRPQIVFSGWIGDHSQYDKL